MPDFEIATRLIMALGLGGLVGLEREAHGSDAGLRTHILVCLGSAVFMVVSILMGETFEGSDPARIAAQVVSGIGFLGAGAILRSSPSIRGLTTAASIWAVAGIGLASGGGFFRPALMTTLLMVTTLWFLRYIEEGLRLKEKGAKKK